MRQLGARMPELPALEEVQEERPTRTPAAPPREPATAFAAPAPSSASVEEMPAATAPAPEPEAPVRLPGRTRITEHIQPAAPAGPSDEVPSVVIPSVTEAPAAASPTAPPSAAPDLRAAAAPARPEPRKPPTRPSDPPAPQQQQPPPPPQPAPQQRASQPVYGDELPFRKLGGPRFEELRGEPRVDELRFDDMRFRHVRFEDAPAPEASPVVDETVRAGSILGLSSNYEPRLSTRSRSMLDDEPKHHFPFMTFAVPGAAAVLALGALLWSGALRDRMHDQDAAVSQLQQQNQRLEDALDQMNRDNLGPAARTRRTGPLPTTTHPSNAQDLVPPPDKPQNAPVPPVATSQPANAPAPSNSAANTPDAAASNPATTAQPSSAPAPAAQLNSGQSTPPPMVHQGERSVRTGYHPQLVAPYPTNFQPGHVADDRGASQASPNPGLYVGPSVPHAGTTPTIARTERSTGRGATPPATASTPYHAPFTVGAGATPVGGSPAPVGTTAARTATPDTTQYTATSSGAYVSPLAQNIEMVESLQRHSQVPLEEFHAREGLVTRVAPTLGVTVDRLDSGHGSYGLLVHSGSASYQLHGQVNAPVIFSDAATNRAYELVVLRIADQQVYGYVKPARQ